MYMLLVPREKDEAGRSYIIGRRLSTVGWERSMGAQSSGKLKDSVSRFLRAVNLIGIQKGARFVETTMCYTV